MYLPCDTMIFLVYVTDAMHSCEYFYHLFVHVTVFGLCRISLCICIIMLCGGGSVSLA